MHSRYSHDSSTSLPELVERARELGFSRIALTDHNTAEGALELATREPGLCIPGEEVKTTEGEVIGLYVTRTIRPWRRPEEVMDEIREMGGLVYVAHPFDRWRASFRPERILALADRIDVIETYNQWADSRANMQAAELARELGKAGASGSDAHGVAELGHSWNEVEPFSSPAELVAALARGIQHRSEVSGTQRRA
jgi:predicted metal-dependent phosphoesterase TrpH